MSIENSDREGPKSACRSLAAGPFDGAKKLPVSRVADLPPASEIVYLGVGYDDRLIVVTSSADPAQSFAGRDESPGAASFPHSMAAERYPIEVMSIDAEGSMTTMRIERVPVAHPFVQPMPDGGVLLVGARARYEQDEAEHNAWLVSPEGSIVHSFCAGDGIQSVQVSQSGRIWISYFDEGVFGNFGWGRADSPLPIGQSGLICWSVKGDRLYEFSPPPGFGPIDDCYALSVVGEDAWACYYSDFPVIRVDENFETTAWNCGIDGAHALAVGLGRRVGLVGGYSGLFDRLVIVDLGDRQTERTATYQLVMPDGSDLAVDARIVARGRYINVVVESQWLRFDIENAPAS